MNEAVNKLVVTLLSQPLFLVLVLLGVIYIIMKVFYTLKGLVTKNNSKTPETKKVDETYKEEKVKICPKCGGMLKVREGKYGKFYGCSNYPNCRHTEKINS